MASEKLTFKILNYDQMLHECQAIAEACEIMNIPKPTIQAWLHEYLKKNMEMEVL